MLKTKDSSQRLKRIKNQDNKFAYTLTAGSLPTFLFNHDMCLKDVIGKFLHDNDLHRVSFEKPADAVIGQFHFELDNGHMNEAQLEEKIRLHYANANVQAVFIMRHREKPELENQRLQMIFGLSDRILHDQPNKILAACYTQYLKDGIIYNRKGPAKIVIRDMTKRQWVINPSQWVLFSKTKLSIHKRQEAQRSHVNLEPIGFLPQSDTDCLFSLSKQVYLTPTTHPHPYQTLRV